MKASLRWFLVATLIALGISLGPSNPASAKQVSSPGPITMTVTFVPKSSPQYSVIWTHDHPRATRKVDGFVHPDHAYGCNVNVCIQVEGNGLQVTFIETTAYYMGPKICTYSKITLNSQSNPIWYGDVVCGASGVFTGVVTSGLPRNFANNSKLCANWYVIAGLPCEYVTT